MFGSENTHQLPGLSTRKTSAQSCCNVDMVQYRASEDSIGRGIRKRQSHRVLDLEHDSGSRTTSRHPLRLARVIRTTSPWPKVPRRAGRPGA